MGGTGFKVAVCNSTTALSGANPTGSAQLVDFLGCGAANAFEGAAAAGAPSNANSVSRKNGGCTDTDNNSLDFDVPAPAAPRNSATAVNNCGTQNTPPNITAIANQNTPRGVVTGPISFDVSDGESATADLNVTASSDNVTLVPVANIVTNGTGTIRTITITPAAGQQGSATITVSVTDTANNVTSTNFVLFVGRPSITAMGNLSMLLGGIPPTNSFSISDVENDALTVTASSSNQGLAPDANISVSPTGANRTIVVTPVAGQSGVAIISVIVSDTFTTTTNTYSFTVSPSYGVFFMETFTYVDGTQLSYAGSIGQAYPGGPAESSPWNTPTSGGTAFQLVVTNGSAIITQTNSEDLAAAFSNIPIATNSGAILYVGAKIQLTTLPTGNGDYFLHLKDTVATGSTFRAKLFATTNGAAPGSFHFGISNASNAPPNIQFAQNLSLNTYYNVVVRYNVDTASSTLWVNPTAETDAGVTATDATIPSEVDGIGMRETGTAGGTPGVEGVEWIDSIIVSTSFDDVIPVLQPKLAAVIANGNIVVSWLTNHGSGFTLQTNATVVSGGWHPASPAPTVVDNKYVVTNGTSPTAVFYRLQGNP